MLQRLVWLAAAAPLLADPIQQAFDRLYNFDFRGAHALLDQRLAERPGDPMGHSVRAAVYLFSELDRLGILEAEFFADDRRITDSKRKLKPDPEVRARFLQAVEKAQSLADGSSDDPEAFYALCMSHGVLVDYTALIDRKHLASLSQAKRSNACAQRLLRAYPANYDAYVTVGFSEYLVGSLPFFLRWFVRFEGVEGDKQAGIRLLHQAAQSARYLGPFAKILLSVAYLREKKPQESRRWLAEFNRDYPENHLVRRELARLTGR
jgi:hypothetical protein